MKNASQGPNRPGMEPLLRTVDLKVHFNVDTGASGLPWQRSRATVHAVDGVTLTIHRGETMGLVGESGCGKSTFGRSLMGLQPSTEGEIYFGDRRLAELDRAELRSLCQDVQIVFQDPFSSLNPRMTVGTIIERPLRIHTQLPAHERAQRVAAMLQTVGLHPEDASRYPHEFSGGQRQRIIIARALILKPDFVIADEPTSALDVSIQAQILTLLQGLKDELGLALLFITHDLGIVRVMCDRVAVMYLGRIVELGHTRGLFERPLHPYTQALLSAIPVPEPEKRVERIRLVGGVPSALDPPPGCRLHPRCPFARADCAATVPELAEHEPGHGVACTYAGRLQPPS